MADERPVARTKHGELSLDQLAEIQPGLGRLMPESSGSFRPIRPNIWSCARAKQRTHPTTQVSDQSGPPREPGPAIRRLYGGKLHTSRSGQAGSTKDKRL